MMGLEVGDGGLGMKDEDLRPEKDRSSDGKANEMTKVYQLLH